MNEFLYAPVLAGFWTHRDLMDNVFDVDDLMDAHEMLAVRAEDERRSREAAERENRR